MEFMRGLVKTLIILIIILAFAFGVVMGFVYSPFFRFPTGGEYPPPHIRELVWPTIACPAMIVPGGTFVVEMDLREEGNSGPQPDDATGWRAEITPARKELAGLSYSLEHRASRTGPSEWWPVGSREGRSDSVWHVEFKVPAEVPPELYDLRVEAQFKGKSISDEQPHSLAVIEGDDNDFTFITLADIHVHERNNYTLVSKQTNKGISEDGEPLFLDEAIEQVNLIKPDFALMLGDYVRGQRRPGELESEYVKFYDRLLDLQVPAYLIPGNHDKYINEIDGARFYEENLGPLYYSFDVGDCHFSCLDTYQWPEDDRVVLNKILYMDPNKWQGQVLEAGDELDPSTYSGELAWLEDDLAAHAQSSLRVITMHHDPYTEDGQGASYRTVTRLGLGMPGGGGKGREALLELSSRYRVDMVFGGHLHVDKVGFVPWTDGRDETTYSCQTYVYFGGGGMDRSYPGYRLVEVEDGEITSFAYQDDEYSFPFYDGSMPGAKTDIDRLERPALQVQKTEVPGDGEWRLDFEVDNYLATGMELSGLVAPAPQRAGGAYSVEGGEIYGMVPIPQRPGWVLLYLKTRVKAGEPAETADLPGQPSTATVTVR